MKAIFGRVITAMVTPFNERLEVDYGKAAELADRLISSGSDGIVVAGTTGESPTLSTEEKIELFRTVVRTVAGRVPVIAGTGSNSTASTLALTQKAADTGVDGVMLVVPYYNKPSQEGLYQHFKAAAASTGLPVILYNVPGRTASNLLSATVLRLAVEIPNIVAIKEASGNLDQVSEILRGAPENFAVYSGDDSLTLPILSIGGCGIISVASHLAAGKMAEMVQAHFKGDCHRAADLHAELFPVMKGLFITSNPVPVKAALRLTGFDPGGVRPPLVEASGREIATLKQIMTEAGLL